MLQKFRKHRQEEINALSTTSAIGWTGLFNGFSGEDGEKASPQDLLPFQDSNPKVDNRISRETQEIIKILLSRGILPPVIHSQISQLKDASP